MKIDVLMITGVYYPEINGAVLQCAQLIRTLGKSIHVSVLTGTNNQASDGSDYVEGISVTRVLIPKAQKLEYIVGGIRFAARLARLLAKTNLVHIHGFSRRNAIVIAICRLFNKKVILKMTSFGHDDPVSVRNRELPIFWLLFKCCHAYIGLSPAFATSYGESRLPRHKYNFIPNAVDLDRYSPVPKGERKALRSKYGFTENDRVILFVGHFSPEKRPLLLYRAWTTLCEQHIHAKIVFIGRTKSFYEVDDEIIEIMKRDAVRRGILSFIHFVESTLHVDEYMKIADVFVLPSIREGLPNVLLEAMACELACIVANLPGVTDWLIDDGKTGILFSSDNSDVLAEKIAPFVTARATERQMGLAARLSVESGFSCASTSMKVLDLYRRTVGYPAPSESS